MIGNEFWISRFVQRLLIEAHFLGADCIKMKGAQAQTLRQQVVLKQVPLADAALIWKWFWRRGCYFDPVRTVTFATQGVDEFRLSYSFGAWTVDITVQGNSNDFYLVDLHFSNSVVWLEQLGAFPGMLALFDNLSLATVTTVVGCSTDLEQEEFLERSLCAWSRRNNISTKEEEVGDTRETLTLIKTSSLDPLTTVRSFFSGSLDEYKGGDIVFAWQHWLQRPCPLCGSWQECSVNDFTQLPSEVCEILPQTFRRGPGCARCSGSGLVGWVPVTDSAVLSAGSEATIQSLGSDDELGECLVDGGLRGMLDDGLVLATHGLIEVEQLVALRPFHSHSLVALIAAIKNHVSKVSRVSSDRALPSDYVDGEGAEAVVLLVEDDPDQRELLNFVLSTAGYKVILAENGAIALRLLAVERPSIIISDLMMPVVDGAELVKLVRADQRLRDLPILITTVVTDEEQECELLRLGVDDYCQKTVDRRVFLRRVERLITRGCHDFHD